jgi:exonuclease III
MSSYNNYSLNSRNLFSCITSTSGNCNSNSFINVSSFNCRGAMSSCLYIETLLKQCDILCLQEHHLFNDNMSFISTMHNDFDNYTVCSSYVSHTGTRIRQGGVSIMWRKNISAKVSPLHDIGNERIQVIQIQSNHNKPVYLFNVYLPSSNQANRV